LGILERFCGNLAGNKVLKCVSRGNEAIRMTYDHRATDEAEAARIKENQGWVVNKKVAGIINKNIMILKVLKVFYR
jgi:hypothetical protein